MNGLVIAYLPLGEVYFLPSSANATDSILTKFFEPELIAWCSLSYRANSDLGKVTSDVNLRTLPVKMASDLLIADPAGEAFQTSGAPLVALSVHSNINPLFGSDEILATQSWLDPNGAGALQRVRLRRGKENWQKSYSFHEKWRFSGMQKPKEY